MKLVLDGKYASARSVLALGMFDGVHLGHRVLVRRARSLADRLGAELVVCTFAQHPLSVLSPQKCPPMLSTLAERAALLGEMGADVLYAMPVQKEWLAMEPEVYVGQLVRRFHPAYMVCGYSHTFGRGGLGRAALLDALGAGLGFGVSVVPEIRLDGREVSSSAVRREVAKGNAREAWRLLGRPYALEGQVEAREPGRTVIRLERHGKLAPQDATYLLRVCDGARAYPVQAPLCKDGVTCALSQQAPLGRAVTVQFLG